MRIRQSVLTMSLTSALALGAVFASPAQAASFREGGVASAPPAFGDFCRQYADQCQPKGGSGLAKLSGGAWEDLRSVNAAVNGRIRQVTDSQLYGQSDRWVLPSNGAGDCEDIVLLKRKMLIQRGWSSANLLVTVVRDERGDGHAVLTVTTNEGDYVLDNRTSSIRLATSTPYRYYTRQSRTNPKSWVSLRGGSAPKAIASRSNTSPDAKALFKWRLANRGFH